MKNLSFTALLLLSISVFLFPVLPVMGQDQPPESAVIKPIEEEFRSGIDAFNKKQWETANKEFTRILEREPKSAIALYNLGATEFHQGLKGRALARFRMALYLDENLPLAAAALRYASAKVDRPFQARELSTFEYLRSAILLTASLTAFVLLTAGLLGLTGLFIIWHVARRRKALEEGVAPTNFSPAGMISVGLTLIAITLFVVKIIDRGVPRVTVIEKRTPLLAGPATDTLSLMEIPEGNELIVKGVHSDSDEKWLHVSLPGSMSGWISAKHVLLSAGDPTW